MNPLELVGCPDCGAPAEIAERYVLDSTDGPIEFATAACLARHRFTVEVGCLIRADLSSGQEAA